MRFPRALHVDYHTAAILEWVEGRLRAAAVAAAQAEDAAAPRLVVPWRSSGACDSDDEEDEDDEVVIVEDGAPNLRGEALAGAAGRGARDDPLALSDDDAGTPAAVGLYSHLCRISWKATTHGAAAHRFAFHRKWSQSWRRRAGREARQRSQDPKYECLTQTNLIRTQREMMMPLRLYIYKILAPIASRRVLRPTMLPRT